MRRPKELPNKVDVAIVGGGICGCSIAYNLAKKGLKVALFERSYLASGATGRCGGGIRQQWSTKENILLAMGSVRIFEKLSEELGYDIEYFQGGYLVIAHTEEEVKQFKKNVELQRSLGLDVKYLEASEINNVVDVLDVEAIGALGATWCPTDGHADPARTTFAYARAASKLGALIYTYTEVKGFELSNGRIAKVKTALGDVSCDWVVNAAGAYATEVAKWVEVELPVEPYRHEILATEPLDPLFTPMVISFHDNVYFRQTRRGEVVGGWGNPHEPAGYNLESSLLFVKRFTKLLTKYVPRFKGVCVVRQWAGLYAVTPDARPILGPVEKVPNFIQVTGFSGHGFMVAPKVAEILANYIASGVEDPLMKELNLKRFEEGRIVREASVVG